ncbi:MAG: hypothetical protein LQ346_007250 [Caloplaca aetnensis]|nr:MAG: hypothetical protein LQ346_007250 [Caloplaca aetnensis]
MRGLRLVCLIFSPAICSSVAIVLPNPAVASPISTPVLDDIKLGALPNLPDTSFSYRVAYRSEPLSSLPSTMAGVAAMRDLAMMGFDDPVSTTQQWTHPEYPGVTVAFAEDNGKPVRVRWAMFLVHASIKDMMLRDVYQASVFFGYYRRRPIGRVLFYPTGHPPASIPSLEASSTAKRGKDTTNLDIGLFSASRVNDELQARVEYVNKAMDRRDALLTILYLLIGLGGRHNSPLQAYHCSLQAVTAEVRTIWNTIPSPGAPYVLRSGDMVNMIARLAVVLVRDDTWKEMNLIVEDGVVVIARGAIRVKPLAPKPPGTDVSTA